ncbi:MAG: Do family serine endopeptidase [Alphaproteobacteria bacterium]
MRRTSIALIAAFVAVLGPWDAPAATSVVALPSLAPMIKQVAPAVVNVAVQTTVEVETNPLFGNPLFSDPFFRNFFDLPGLKRERKALSAGSGVVIDAGKGLIVTNFHVIARADAIEITTQDRRTLAAELVGADPETDIALLHVEADGLTAIEVGDSDALEVGDFVVAIGNPFGIGQTVTLGIVSALGRGVGLEAYEDFIQTDASINPGHSGGALVDMAGRLVGINTAILGRAGSIGIGFAIPTAIVRRIVEQIVEHGGVARGQIGVRTQDLTPDLALAMGLERTEGVLVVDVMKNSPAAESGLAPGDVIVAANGVAVTRGTEVRNLIGLMRVGDTVELDVVRAGAALKLSATIAERTSEPAPVTGAALLEGARFEPNADGQGVLVAEVAPASPAYRAGLREGDVIVAVNRTPVASPEDLMKAVEASPGRLSLGVVRGTLRVFILIG